MLTTRWYATSLLGFLGAVVNRIALETWLKGYRNIAERLSAIRNLPNHYTVHVRSKLNHF